MESPLFSRGVAYTQFLGRLQEKTHFLSVIVICDLAGILKYDLLKWVMDFTALYPASILFLGLAWSWLSAWLA
jgi:hypothetical protein